MRVKVRLFARLRDIAGYMERERDVDEGMTVGALWTTLVGEHPALAPYTAAICCALNEDYSRRDVELHDGDEVAFLPPVSGG